MLAKQKREFLTTREVKPTGWLRRQLEIQAAGLSGNLDKVWPDVRDSRWIGGDREGWERVPYWLDGFIPLAWLLDDKDMQARATRYIDAILERQQADGWICPCTKDERADYDMWALMLIGKVLALYGDCTGDPRIEGALYRALRQFEEHISGLTLFDWGSARWFECLIPIYWLYERRPEKWLLDLAVRLQAQGVDYESLYRNWIYDKPARRWDYLSHVVNTAMMLKGSALMSRVDGKDPDAFAEAAWQTLMRDHGMACGHFSGDECLAGTSPIRGSELCSVVEAMYSYEWLAALTGKDKWCDRLEDAAFNALPAAISPDMWSHQYDQMPNQVQCSWFPEGEKPFGSNGNDANIFGLEPNYGCCTANFNQGWPKLALSALMRTEEGLAMSAIAPVRANVVIGGSKVECEIETNYPFEDGYRVRVRVDRPVTFALDLRIPGFAESARVDGAAAQPGAPFRVEKEWQGETVLTVEMAFSARYEQRPSGMFCLRRGPLLYSLPIKEQWHRVEYTRNGVDRKFPYCDYEILPMSPWNYGFTGKEPVLVRGEVGEVPFSPEGAPVWLEVEMAQVEWAMGRGACEELPRSDKAIAPPEMMRLIPYGCTNLRMTEMPMTMRS